MLSLVCGIFVELFLNSSCSKPTEDAKRLAIKEEQYDPGYEDAYGGAYVEKGPVDLQAQSQINGHCTFSSAANSGMCELNMNQKMSWKGMKPTEVTADHNQPNYEKTVQLKIR